MGKRYETMEFVIGMVEAHPYIEGRKTALRKALNRMSGKTLSRFVERYAKLNENDKELIDRFLRNYGRYEGIRFSVSTGGPEEVRAFAKNYNLKIRPAFLAYWCESQRKRIRRRLLTFIL